jgi:hypothetical protein
MQEILHCFELLSEGDKQELATEILRRSLTLDSPPLSDEQLIGTAEELFLQLDDREGQLYRLAELATPSGIPDLAVNIDHYLYGHPKVDDAKS